MYSIRPQYASRLLSRRRLGVQQCLGSRRWASQTADNANSDKQSESATSSSSSDPPGAVKGPSEMITTQTPAERLPERLADHLPDYQAPVDHGTSSFSPIPKHIMDGSEPGEVLPAAVLSGAPVDLQARTVRIYRPAKTATQSGDWSSHHWRMDWDVLQKGHRWENPLMGWQSSGDYLQGTHLNFKSKDDAIHFAEKQGYEYFVQEPNERRFVPKAYANNFLHSPKTLKHIRTK